MGVFNPTVRTEEELQSDLAYIEQYLHGSPNYNTFKEAIRVEAEYRDNPSEALLHEREEILRQLGLKPKVDHGTQWGPPPHPLHRMR